MSNKIRKCSYCGSKPEVVQWAKHYRVECQCGRCGPKGLEVWEAIQDWDANEFILEEYINA